MFKLIDGTELTEEIKDAFKKKVTKAYIKLKDGTILSGENFLKSLEIEDLRYNEETNNFLGEAVAKRATVDLYNKDNAINVEDEEFEAFIGAELSDGTTAWISYGNFIVQKPENDDTKEDTVIEAFDYMCKFNKIYTPGVTFPCTYADIVEDICEQCGVELANRDFRNAEKVVKENFFINGEQCRAVLKQVAKIAFSWARVGNDNKLYIDFKNKDIEETFENFDLDSYIDLNKNNQLIPVDTIVLRNSAIESENVTIKFDKNAKINKFIGDMEQDTIAEVAGTTVENDSVNVTDVDFDFETEVLPMGAINQDTSTQGKNLLDLTKYAETTNPQMQFANMQANSVDIVVKANTAAWASKRVDITPLFEKHGAGDYHVSVKIDSTSGINNTETRPYGIWGIHRNNKGTNTNASKYEMQLFKADTTYSYKLAAASVDTELYDYYLVFYPTDTATLINETTFKYKEICIAKESSFSGYAGFIPDMPSKDYPSNVKGVGSEKNINLARIEKEGYYRQYGTGNFAVNTSYNSQIASVEPNKTYTIKKTTGDHSNIAFFGKDMTYISGIANATTIITPDNCYFVTVAVHKNTNDFMFYEGTEDLPYTPYGYCRYNTAVRNINLVDDVGIIKTGTHGGLTVATENGKIIVNGTPTSNYPVISQTVNITDLLEDGETYTLIRFGEKGIYNQCRITKTDGTTTHIHASSVKAAKFTFNKAKMKKVSYAIQSGAIASTGTLTNHECNFMLVKGDYINTNVNYMAHQEQSFLIDIPIGQVWYSGKPYKVGSKWYRDVEWKKKVFNGAENWTYYEPTKVFFDYDIVSDSKKVNTYPYCNYLKGGGYGNKSGTIMINNAQRVHISLWDFTTVAELKSWLQELYANGTPLYMVYELAEPYPEEITDTHLIAQLEAIKAAELYDGVTNVNSYKTSDDVAEMPLSVRYNFITSAPSTDRESPINKVTGACNLYNVRGNLFDVDDLEQKGVNATKNSDDSITITYDNTAGTAVKYINYYTHKTNRLKPNTNYYVVVEILDVSGTGTLNYISQLTQTSQITKSQYAAFASLKKGEIKVTQITTTDDFTSAKWMLRTFCSFNAGESGSITFRLSVFEQEPDLEKFVYKKFNSQQFPLNLGSLELLDNEYIYWKNNKWYKHKLIDKYNSDLDKEGWIAETGNAGGGATYRRFRKSFTHATSKQIRQAIISNRFVSTLDGKHPIGGAFAWVYQIFIYPPKEITTADLLKEWFVSNPTIIYYYTDTPIEEEITDTTLLSQLNTIKDEFFLVEGENHIMFSCDNGTQPQLEIKHYPNKYSLKETISTGNDLTLNASYEHRELVVKEDYFAYNEETRRDLIQSARELFGLTYLPVDLSGIGTAYLENNDLVTVTDKMGNVRPTYCLNHTLKYNGVLYDTIAAPAMTETETKYQNESQEDLSRRRTEVIVNKATQEIQLVSEKVDTYDSRISEVEVGLDGIISKIESDIDITRTINGLKTLTLEECLEGDLLELHIYGNNQVFKRITPSGTTYPSNELIVKDDSLIKITRKEIDEAGNYIKETSETIDLKIKEVLRQLGDVADSFDLVNNKATLTRRIGVNTDNSLYVLTNPIVEDLGDLKIPLVRGTNIIEIVNYSAMMSAKYVIINAFTNTFATTVDLKSAIEILYNQINLEVSKKVNDDEIIARINMAILGRDEVEIPDDINKSIIEILANKISIKSDYFELTKDGQIVTRRGDIGNLSLYQNTYGSWLNKSFNTTDGSLKFQSGLFIPDNFDLTTPFVYAGLDMNGDTAITNANAYITHQGKMYAKWFDVNGESGYFNINFNSGKQALALRKDSLTWKIDDSGNEKFFEMWHHDEFFDFDMYAARILRVMDITHQKEIFSISKFSPETGQTTGSLAGFSCNVGITGTREGTGEECKLYVQGYEILKTASDERIKDNIVDSEIEALKVINQIHHKSFDWNKEKAHKEGHIDIGYIAQELIEIDPNFVVHDKEYDTYQINTLYVLSTATKAIQELDKKLNKQQKIIDFLINKLDCKDEISEILKEGE